MTAPVYTCDYCIRPYSDPRGCEYLDDDPRPMTFGEECHPLSTGDTCRDCGTPKGREHHAYCLQTECPHGCHRQFHPGLTCVEDAKLTTGAAA